MGLATVILYWFCRFCKLAGLCNWIPQYDGLPLTGGGYSSKSGPSVRVRPRHWISQRAVSRSLSRFALPPPKQLGKAAWLIAVIRSCPEAARESFRRKHMCVHSPQESMSPFLIPSQRYTPGSLGQNVRGGRCQDSLKA